MPWPIGIGATHVETQACNWDLRNVDKVQLHVEVEMEVEQVLQDAMSLQAVVAALMAALMAALQSMAGSSLANHYATSGPLAEEVVDWTHKPDD